MQAQTITGSPVGDTKINCGPYYPLWGPCVIGTTTSSAIVIWKTDVPAAGVVYYATADYYNAHHNFNEWSCADPDTQMHRVVLKGLSPGTQYYYLVKFEDGRQTPLLKFMTLPISGKFTFIVDGDSRANIWKAPNSEPGARLVSERIANESNVAFVLHDGDFVNNGDELNFTMFFQDQRAMLGSTTFYPSLGNHEYMRYSPTYNLYNQTFGLPSHYYFDCAGVRFVILNSNDPTDYEHPGEYLRYPVPSLQIAQSQVKWLTDALNTNARMKFVMFHYPPYTNKKNATDPDPYACLRLWSPIMDGAGVDAVFNGHIHNFEYYRPNNTPYFIIGTGGAPLYPLYPYPEEGYKYGCTNILGYGRVTVSGNTSLMEMIKVADIDNNNTITKVYPPNTVIQRVKLG